MQQHELLQDLKKAAKNVATSKSKVVSQKRLLEAFALFSQEAAKLETAYKTLEGQFQEVQQKLLQMNEDLTQKVKELDLITHYLNNVLKNISQGIIFVNLDGIITLFNETAQKLLQKDKGLLFKSFWDHFSDDFFGFSLKESLALSQSQSLNYITLPSKKEIELISSFVFEEEQNYRGIIIVLRDITELQKLQRINDRNDRMKELGEVAATVAHEIRNPLGGIRGFAALLCRDLKTTPHLQGMAKSIVEGTQSLERIVNNILHFARPVELKPTLIDLITFLKEFIKFIKADPTFPEGVTIELHLPLSHLTTLVDKELLHSALLNLFVNAIQSIEGVGKITLSLFPSTSSVSLTISDSGKGIDPVHLEHIFSPFFTTKEKGTGIGLSETYKIVQAHGGTIDVRSQINQGTTFTITLPLRR